MEKVTIRLHPLVARDVATLWKTGLYGKTQTEVVERLFLEALRRELPPMRLVFKP